MTASDAARSLLSRRSLGTIAYVVGKSCLYLLLIALCILLSPDQPVQFIYTEF